MNSRVIMVPIPIIISRLFKKVYYSITSQSMSFPSRNTWWVVQCVNLEAWHSIVLRQVLRKWTTSFRSSQYWTSPIKWHMKILVRFSYVRLRMHGQNSPISNYVISRWKPTRKLVLCSSKWKFLNKSTKGEHLLKHPLGLMTTVAFALGKKGGGNPHHLINPRRAVLASARQKYRSSKWFTDRC